MKVIDRNVMLRVDSLHPHPDNPRKDVGDVTELADSIKANGIFQNLTVIETDGENEDYTVIIGHRRLAAAKQAGLKEIPCMVVEMTANEQVSTMLLENMQRNDLTVYEQAQGFQMMLDLGETEQSIAEKTGFSKTTVKHRLKLLELDPEEFKKAEEKGATLDDYIELEKIHDKDLKNKALKEIGTSNFRWNVQNAINKEKREINKSMWDQYLKSRLEEVAYTTDREFLNKYPYLPTSELTEERKQEIEKLIAIEEDTSPNPEVYYAYDSLGYIYIVGKMKDKSAETVQQMKYDAQQELYRRRKERIAPIEEQAQQLREKFINDWEGGKKELELIVFEYLTSPYILNYSEVDYEELADRMGLNDIIDPDEEDEVDEDTEPHERLAYSPKYLEAVAKKPQKAMLYLLANEYEGGNTPCCHDYFGNHIANQKLKRWYNTLRRLGYRISDDEQALLDGTHECFEEEDPEE